MENFNMQALVTASNARAIVKEIPIPEPGAGQVRVRVRTVALNPVDALYVAHPASGPGRVVGSDFAGVVDTLGEGVSALQVGDDVAGFLHGACQENVLPGAFAEYLVVDADLVYKIPSSMSLEEAATLPLCLLTATNGLFRVLDLIAPWSTTAIPSQPSTSPRLAILIYSGATSVGCYAIQLARLSPSSPLIITTASPSNASYLLSLGAGHVLDYHDAHWTEQARNIAKAAGAEFKWALDCISEGGTVEKTSQVFERKGKIATVRGPTQWSHDGITRGVEVEYMAAWTLLGKEFWLNGGNHFPAQPTHRALAVGAYAYISAANPASPISTGQLKANKVRFMPGGLENIPDAFPLLGSGRVTERAGIDGMKPLRAEKMVYRIEQQ